MVLQCIWSNSNYFIIYVPRKWRFYGTSQNSHFFWDTLYICIFCSGGTQVFYLKPPTGQFSVFLALKKQKYMFLKKFQIWIQVGLKFRNIISEIKSCIILYFFPCNPMCSVHPFMLCTQCARSICAHCTWLHGPKYRIGKTEMFVYWVIGIVFKDVYCDHRYEAHRLWGRHTEEKRRLDRDMEDKIEENEEERGTGWRRRRGVSIGRSVCNGYTRTNVYIRNLGSKDIDLLEINQEAHLVKDPRYEAPNHFMAPCPWLYMSSNGPHSLNVCTWLVAKTDHCSDMNKWDIVIVTACQVDEQA